MVLVPSTDNSAELADVIAAQFDRPIEQYEPVPNEQGTVELIVPGSDLSQFLADTQSTIEVTYAWSKAPVAVEQAVRDLLPTAIAQYPRQEAAESAAGQSRLRSIVQTGILGAFTLSFLAFGFGVLAFIQRFASQFNSLRVFGVSRPGLALLIITAVGVPLAVSAALPLSFGVAVGSWLRDDIADSPLLLLPPRGPTVVAVAVLVWLIGSLAVLPALKTVSAPRYQD